MLVFCARCYIKDINKSVCVKGGGGSNALLVSFSIYFGAVGLLRKQNYTISLFQQEFQTTFFNPYFLFFANLRQT